MHKEYLIHDDTPFPLPDHLQLCADYSIAKTQQIRLKSNNFCV